MKKRVFAIVLTVILCAASLFGCMVKPEDPEGMIWNKDSELYIIVADEGLGTLVDRVFDSIAANMNKTPTLQGASYVSQKHELVLGRADRPVSTAAYAELEKMSKGDREIRYLIYSDGNSVCIAYDVSEENLAATTVIEYFLEHYVGESLTLKAGVAYSAKIDLDLYQQQKDDAAVEEQWKKLADAVGGELGDEIVDSMKKLYGIYDEKVIEWFAGLYDPGVGGYYYSNSARDNIGYLPDAESTSQALGFWSSSGMAKEHGGVYYNAVPDWMKAQIVAFIKGLQDPNGFFYHPQWGKALTDSKISRRARDLNWCVNILKSFGEKPKYDTPTGVSGEGIDEPTSYILPLTGRLPLSSVFAVSRVVATESTASYAEYLENRETFEAYLAGLDIRNKSYPVGNEITASSGQIKARDLQLQAEGADYSLMQITIDWLNKNQNPETGLWNWDDDLYYGVNGLLKISGIYTAFDSPIPHAEEAAQSAIDAITYEAKIGAVVDLYNTWFSVSNILKNLRTCSVDKTDGAARADAIVSSLRQQAPYAIIRSMEKIIVFRKEDGSFSYTPNASSSTSQGVPAAVPGSNEGDVNGTVIAITGLIGNIYSALELSSYKVQLFTESDRLRYIELLEALSPIDKSTDTVITVDPLDFENETVGNEPDSVIVNIGDGSKGTVTVIADGNDGKGIELVSKKGGYDSVRFSNTASMAATAGCYVFESDFMVTDEGTDDSHYFAQIQLQSACAFTFRTAGDGMLHIWETSSFSQVNARETEIAVVPLDTWFNIRIEYYYGTRSTVRIKSYINDKLVAVTDNYYNSSGDKLLNLSGNSPSSYYDYAQIAVTKDYNAVIRMDNVYVAKEAKAYEVEDDTDLIWNCDISGAERKVHTFDDGESLSAFEVTSGGATVEADGELSIASSASGSGAVLKLPINIRDGVGDASVFGASITATSASDGLVGRIVFAENNSKEYTIAALRLTVITDGGQKYLTLFEENGSGAAVSEIAGARVAIEDTLDLRVAYFRLEGSLLIFVDDKMISISTSVYSSAHTRQCALLKLETASNKESSLLIDDLYFERVATEFADAAAPETPSEPDVYTELVSNGAGKVLYSVNANQRSDTYNATVLSAKFNFVSGSSGANQRLVFYSEEGSELFAFDFYKVGDKILIKEVTENGTREATFAELAVDTVYTLRFEIFYENGVCNLLVDGNKKNASNCTYYMDADIKAACCVRAEFVSLSSDGKMTHEGLVLENYTVLYSAISNSGNSENGGAATFDNSSTGCLPNSISASLKSSGSSVAVKESVIDGKVESVLEFTTKPGANDTFSYKVANNVSASDSCVVIEARIKIDWVANSSIFQFYLDGQSTSSTGIGGYFFQVDYSNGRLKFLDASNNNSSETVNGNTYTRYTGPSVDLAAEGEWFDLRIEYYVGNADEIVIKTYVNDTLIYVSNCYHKSHRGTAPLSESIIGFRAYSLGSSEATLSIDEINIYSDNRVCSDDEFTHDITK